MWQEVWSDQAKAQLKHLDKSVQRRLLERVSRLCGAEGELPQPKAIKPLRGKLAGLWRLRVGDFRVVYRPDPPGRRLEVVSVGHRREVYG